MFDRRSAVWCIVEVASVPTCIWWIRHTGGITSLINMLQLLHQQKDKRSEGSAAAQEVIEMFYFNGDEVQAPVLTKNERELVRKLKDEWFGDGNNCDMISTDYEDSISTLGYTIAEEIEWGNRRSLGGVIASLRKKHVIAVTKGARPKVQTNIVDGIRVESIVRSEPCTELWFDCEALEELLGE